MSHTATQLDPTPHRATQPAAGRPLTIGVVCHASDAGRSGIGQYLVNVVRRLPRVAPAHRFVLFAPAADAGLWDGLGDRVTLVRQPDALDKPLRSMAWHVGGLRSDLAAQGCDVVFLPAGNRRLGLGYGVPSVATVHDLSQLHVPGKYDVLRMFHARRLMPALMRRQDRLICVSENTRRDVLRHARVRADRVSVVYNGADLARFRSLRPGLKRLLAQRFGLYGPYVLYVARLEHPGKNHVRLLDAFARLVAQGRYPHRLVLAGPDWSGSEAIHQHIRRLGIEDRVLTTGFVASEDLPGLYQGADLLAFPSLYEGFGIPLVEAMAAGTAACVSDRGSLPEIAGDAALLFDPGSPASIAHAMEQLLSDASLRDKLVARGRLRAAEFDWDRCAREVVRHIEEACAASA
jgi:glycosyltransferase involved in cell wall biosynthesis